MIRVNKSTLRVVKRDVPTRHLTRKKRDRVIAAYLKNMPEKPSPTLSVNRLTGERYGYSNSLNTL